MRTFGSNFLCVILFCMSAMVFAAAPSTPAVKSSAAPNVTTSYICSNQPVPSGYVVVGSSTDYRCPGLGVYLYGIEPAYDGIVACLGSPYPSPYFITGESSPAYQCTPGFLGSMTLHLPYDGMVACVNGVLWSPWVITGNGSNYQCNGYAFITISQPYENLRICSNSAIPSGWTVSAPYQFYICQPYLTQNMHKIPSFNSPSASGDGQKVIYMQAGDRAIMSSPIVTPSGKDGT